MAGKVEATSATVPTPHETDASHGRAASATTPVYHEAVA